MASESSSDPENLSALPEKSERFCRICFAEGPFEGTQSPGNAELIAPCTCKGSQRWIHRHCLMQWQISVMVDCGTHPAQSSNERRHEICNVCGDPFASFAQPITRLELMSLLANMSDSSIAPGLLLIHEREDPNRDLGGLPPFLQMILNLKHVHFKESMYMVTQIENAHQDDKVIALNLVRPMECDDDDGFVRLIENEWVGDELQRRKDEGMTMRFFYGGPMKPRKLRAIAQTIEDIDALTSSSPSNPRHATPLYSVQEANRVTRLVTADLAAILGADLEISRLFIYAGHAEWTRTQLLGEIARGMWGWRKSQDLDAPHLVNAPNWSEQVDLAEWSPPNSMQDLRRRRAAQARLG